MAEIPGANAPSYWFRAFSRSSNTNIAAAKQSLEQCSSPTTSIASSSSTLRNPIPTTVPPINARPDQLHRLNPRHTFHHHRSPTPTASRTSQSQTNSPAESPSRGLHQKSASATLRSVSSFLSLKGAKVGNGSNASTGKAAAAADPFSHGIRGGLGHPTSPVEAVFSDPEPVQEPRTRPPAPLAMLPLTEIDYGSDSDGYTGHRIRDSARWERSGGTGGGGARGEGTWHNPSLMQTVEMLGAVMVRKGPGKPLSVNYDSCVLTLIEGFYRLTRRLRDTEEKLAELKDLRERELDQFRGMSEEWMETTEAYKAEIKRLELALAKESKDGVASVALVRHGSLVDRAGSKRFQARVRHINKPSEQQPPANPERDRQSSSSPEPPDLTEATSSYRTLSAIPRILDSTNDITKAKRILPRLKIKREHRSFQELSHNLGLSETQRRRCYSFEKGEEVLTVTSPVTPVFSTSTAARSQEVRAKGETPRRPQSGAQRFLFGLTDAPTGSDEEEGGLYMRPRHRQASLKSSASAETVRWTGEAKGNGHAGSAERGTADGAG
ncbi:hypothetical protein VTJ49DRAFT_1381 [Mycothermus thermophilus]|uniref:Uncharacterized protein n=1 Tax=Humicola insolens TaxID=85995 RepID=A0ABR3VD49_HUMIN